MMQPPDKRRAVELLKGARKRIANKRQVYICLALAKAFRAQSRRVGTADEAEDYRWVLVELKRLIQARLRYETTYEDWMRSFQPDAWHRALRFGLSDSMREARINWINNLIIEFGGTP